MSEELKNEIYKEWDNQHMRDYCIKEVALKIFICYNKYRS